ncbi:MAG: hypothetical protein SH821_00730 [Phototrophicales bacterium]|nr:hypothetical protein [Phototrophicales bacterium]
MSFEDEYMSKAKKKTPLNAFLPLIGLFLLAAAAGVGFSLSKPLTEWLQNTILPDNSQDIADNFEVVQLVVGAVVAVIILLFAAMMYAVLAPKPTKLTNERELKKEKEDKVAEDIARKKRRQEVNRKMAEETKRKMGSDK